MPTETFNYGEEHALQTVTVTTLSETLDKKFWIMYILLNLQSIYNTSTVDIPTNIINPA